MSERLYRSRDERIIAGVAGGVAEQFNVDPSLVRVLWAILIIPTGGIALLLYVLMAIIVPEAPAGDARWQPTASTGGTRPTDPTAGAAAAFTAPTAGPPASPAPAMRADARQQRRDARDERRAWRREHRDPAGALIFGLILILVGGYFFTRAVLPNVDLGQVWPVVLVIVGVALVLASVRPKSGSSG